MSDDKLTEALRDAWNMGYGKGCSLNQNTEPARELDVVELAKQFYAAEAAQPQADAARYRWMRSHPMHVDVCWSGHAYDGDALDARIDAAMAQEAHDGK